MKKVLRSVVAIPVLAGLAAVPAIAADQLDLSGEMRIRATMEDYDGHEDASYMDHRLRMYGKFKVNDNVQVHFRTDLSEDTWGENTGYGSARLPSNSSMQVDRAFLQLDNDSMRFRGGLQYVGISPSYFVDSQDEALYFTIKNDVAPLHLFAVMEGENEFEEELADENWIFGFNTTPTFGAVSTQFFGGYFMGTQDEEIDEESLTITSLEQDQDYYYAGASFSVEAGMATIFGEVNMIGGDYNDSTDAMGLQGWAGADLKVSDALTITPKFFYAMAADEDEKQITYVGNNFNDWNPLFDVGIGLENDEIGIGRPYDWTGEGAGAIGGVLTTKYKINDALNLGAAVNYITVEDDEIVDDSMFGLAAGIQYKFMGNASIAAQVEYHDYDDNDDDDAIMGEIKLAVRF